MFSIFRKVRQPNFTGCPETGGRVILTMFFVAVVLMIGMLVIAAKIMELFALPAYVRLLIAVLVLFFAGLCTIWIEIRNMLQYFLYKFRSVEK